MFYKPAKPVEPGVQERVLFNLLMKFVIFVMVATIGVGGVVALSGVGAVIAPLAVKIPLAYLIGAVVGFGFWIFERAWYFARAIFYC